MQRSTGSSLSTIPDNITALQNAGNAVMEDFAQNTQQEVDLYAQHKQHYGYVFYIAKKL